MSRLADYFVVVGYDHEKERKKSSVKRLINFNVHVYLCLIIIQLFIR